MRYALAMAVLLGGCTELDPNFSVSQWYDNVEENRPTPQQLHTEGGQPGEWARTTEQAREGESSWRFGDGSSWPSLCDASLQTPEFEAGERSFLRFSYYSDIPLVSEFGVSDGAVVEVQVDEEPWRVLETHEGYPYVLDGLVIGSPLSLNEGVLSGDDRTWHDDYVEADEAEPGQSLRFRFRFGCDIDASDNQGAGLFIDDVEYLIVE